MTKHVRMDQIVAERLVDRVVLRMLLNNKPVSIDLTTDQAEVLLSSLKHAMNAGETDDEPTG